jgi:hypothetical protein
MLAGLDTFEEITGYDIANFFSEYQDFVANDYQNIVSYYNGSDPIASSFQKLNELTKELTKIEPLIILNRERFPTIDAWTIIDAYGDVAVAIGTCNNMSKWARSSRTTQYDSQVRVDRILKQGETFETVVANTGVIDFQNEWSLVTIENLIIEEDYTPNGGTLFSITFSNNANFSLANIVDNLQGDNVYGKDIERGFVFEDNDLKILQFQDALTQTLDTILSTRKGGIPEFPEDGIEDSIIGTNVNTIQYPTIFRNLLNMFRKDGRFIDVNLLDLTQEDESVWMKLEVKAILKDAFISNLSI